MKYRIASCLLSLCLACGGAATIPLETTPRTPAAVGVVKDIERGPNQNTIGQLHVQHLASPRELRGDLNVYVAWIRPTGSDRWQNVGQLIVNDSLEGTLQLRVPQDRFEVSVSAENDGDVTEPSEFIVLRGEVDSRQSS